MKKGLLLIAIFAAMMVPSFGAPALCNSITLDQILANGVYAAQGCQTSDKIFTGFSYSGDIAAANIRVTFQNNGPIPAGATIQFASNNGANWAGLTNLSWTTTIDTGMCPTCQFVSVLDQIFTPPTPNDNAGTFTHPGAVPTAVLLSGGTPATLSGNSSILGLTSIGTTFSQTGGSSLQRLSSSVSQMQGVPEPATFVLLGFGLLGFGLYRRKQV